MVLHYFREYMAKILNIPYNKIRYEKNGSITRASLEAIFGKDGWLHNKITDGISGCLYLLCRKMYCKSDKSQTLLNAV